jgi:GH15 family glucan-1,4-alpha-glucosidase
VVLRTPVELRGDNLATVAEFSVAAGECVPFVLTHGQSHLAVPEALDWQAGLRQTEDDWRRWCGQCSYHGPWKAAVQRSLLTLKALTHADTGGIIAAPTTSLPEQLGGARNWDYRYCWLRDATLTLMALMSAGYRDEARAWRDWLLRSALGSPEQIQIMYGVAGERQLNEWEVPWLPGYQGSAPVRIGNAASNQLQLDIYGELLDALCQGRHDVLAPARSGWALQERLIEHQRLLIGRQAPTTRHAASAMAARKSSATPAGSRTTRPRLYRHSGVSTVQASLRCASLESLRTS